MYYFIAFLAGAILSATVTYFVLKNNPGLVEGWAQDLLARKDRLLKEAKEEIERLKGKK
jgi:hypothetical protein